MGNRTRLVPPDYQFFHETPLRGGAFGVICGFFVFFYGIVFISAISNPSTRQDWKIILLFLLFNPLSWILYYFIILMIRNGSYVLYIRPGVIGWSKPTIRGGENVEEIPLENVARIRIFEDSESKALTLFLENGKKVKITEAHLGDLDKFERVIRLQYPHIEVESEVE